MGARASVSAGVVNRILDARRPERGAGAIARDLRGERHCAIREVGDQQLVACAQRQRSEHGVQPRGDVGHEHEIFRVRAEESGNLIARLAQACRGAPRHRVLAVQLAKHEPRRLSLHLVAQRLLALQHAARRCADGAVIEVGAVRIQEPVLQHGAAEVTGTAARHIEKLVARDPADAENDASMLNAVVRIVQHRSDGSDPIQLDPRESKTYFKEMREKPSPVFRAGWNSDYPDPDDWYRETAPLFRVTRRLDPDPVRNQIRDAVAGADRTAIGRLAEAVHSPRKKVRQP